MKTLILCHKSTLDAGAFEKMLKDRGAEIDVRLAFDEGVSDVDPTEHDLTIFMGGPMGAYQEDIFPYIKEEVAYIEKRLEANKPYLGICLGGQLMAKAMGADNHPGNGDTFTLPSEATLLASSEQYKNQAFSYGKALGFQCHPEVTRTNIELWIALGQAELPTVGLGVDLLREQTLEHLETLDKQRTLFFNDWLDEVL